MNPLHTTLILALTQTMASSLFVARSVIVTKLISYYCHADMPDCVQSVQIELSTNKNLVPFVVKLLLVLSLFILKVSRVTTAAACFLSINSCLSIKLFAYCNMSSNSFVSVHSWSCAVQVLEVLYEDARIHPASVPKWFKQWSNNAASVIVEFSVLYSEEKVLSVLC